MCTSSYSRQALKQGEGNATDWGGKRERGGVEGKGETKKRRETKRG